MNLWNFVFRHWPSFVGIERLHAKCDFSQLSNSETERVHLKGTKCHMAYFPDTYMGHFLKYRGIYEEGVIKTVRKLLNPGDGFLDVGANCGLYTLAASELVGPSGVVIAVEPQMRVYNVLCDNVSANGLRNVKTHNLALGSHPKTGKVYQVSPTNMGQATLNVAEGESVFGTPETVSVEPASNIVDWKRSKNGKWGIKIDVEGAELEVLLGLMGSGQESDFVSFIVVECIDRHLYRFGHKAEEIFHFLWDLGFDTYCLYRGKWRPINEVIDHQSYLFSSDVLAVRKNHKVPHPGLFGLPLVS